MIANIPETDKKRIVILGAGFAGLKLARKLAGSQYQVVLIDKNNYHQFQPLYYQVATAGIEPSSISFPLRKIFQKFANVHIRVADAIEIKSDENTIETSIGSLPYDYLVVSIGAETNFFGMKNIKERAIPMKSVTEAMTLRNIILQNYEDAVNSKSIEERQKLMNIVVVGGGPTGVELSGTLAEMKHYIFPKDYPELNFEEMRIYLLEASGKLLAAMTKESSAKATRYLKRLGVHVILNAQVKDYDGENIVYNDGKTLKSVTLIWAAGITSNKLEGIKPEAYGRANRLIVDRFNRVAGYDNIFAVGDIALMTEPKYPNGHPQVAPAAIQHANRLGDNFLRASKGKDWKEMAYHDKGSMATVGRNLAVVDLPFIRFFGFTAWLIWMFVHLMSIVGVKNRLFIFINWLWNYITYDQSLRLILKPKPRSGKPLKTNLHV